MRRALLAMMVLLSACAPAAQTNRDLDQLARNYQRTPPAADLCGMSTHQSLIGMDQAALAGVSLPPGARVICFGCMVTMDHAPGRLNVHLGADGKVASLRCG
jgi:Peptidase inhibitor I78 family